MILGRPAVPNILFWDRVSKQDVWDRRSPQNHWFYIFWQMFYDFYIFYIFQYFFNVFYVFIMSFHTFCYLCWQFQDSDPFRRRGQNLETVHKNYQKLKNIIQIQKYRAWGRPPSTDELHFLVWGGPPQTKT